MIRLRDISFPPEHTVSQLPWQAAKLLRVEQSRIRHVSIVKKSIDARKKPDVKVIYTIDVKVEGNEEKIRCSRTAAVVAECARPDGVIVETSRGTEYALCVQGNTMIDEMELTAPLRPVIRKATEEDKRTVEKNLGNISKGFNVIFCCGLAEKTLYCGIRRSGTRLTAVTLD